MKEITKISASLAAMTGAMLGGYHVGEVKIRDHQAVTHVWKDDKRIGQSLNKASQDTDPIVVEAQHGGRKYISAVRAPDLKVLRTDLQNARDAIDRTGRSEGIKRDLDGVIASVDHGPTVSDEQGRFVDGLQPIRDGINNASDQFAEEESSMNKRKWFDRLLIAVGGSALIGAIPVEAMFLNKELKKANGKPENSKSPDTGSGDNSQRKKRLFGWLWEKATTLPSEKRAKNSDPQKPRELSSGVSNR